MRERWRNEAINQAQADARDNFNIVRENGTDYIYYKSVRITTKTDAECNLLERLNELRNMFLESKMEKIEKEYGKN